VEENLDAVIHEYLEIYALCAYNDGISLNRPQS
jgi:hypothetical protein